ncbi:amino acid adenylation domain-containing protein [Tenacibaculum halocynthiae]|uniref:amino acid adenylation domain-containing protein n=1 Tax=Tenacibaculum halocynthiae TaxID=1254437 RepID=UPI0038955406
MKIDQYISDLRSRDIIISVQDGQIAVKAPDEIITPEIVRELTIKKQEILSFFKLIKNERAFTSISKAKVSEHYPLSSAQHRMYFLYELDKEGTSYNMPGFYKVNRDLDILKVKSAFESLIKRHQSLRTIFTIVENQPVQKVLEADLFEVNFYQGDVDKKDKYKHDFVMPFDLSSDFPIRISLIEIPKEDYLLFIDMHHIINDGVSQEILMNDFWSFYYEKSLPVLQTEYIDYSVWQQGEYHQSLVATHKKYWLNRYKKEFTKLELPTDFSRPQKLSSEGEVYSIKLNAQKSSKLRALVKEERVTMYSLFLAIYNVLLSKLSNQKDIIVGTPTSGRYHSDLEGVVGMFVNTLALRNQISPEITFKEFLKNVKEDTFMAFDHQLYQYEELIDALNIRRDMGRNPLFDVFFSYSKQIDVKVGKNTGSKIMSYDEANVMSKFDLELDVLDSNEIVLSLTYRTDLFSASSITRFSNYLIKIIDEILKDKKVLIKNIEILSEVEINKLLVEFNDTDADYDLNKTVLDMFVDKSLSNPDAIAIVFEKEKMTYRELDIRSDLWATHLIKSGVVSQSIVGLFITRSSEMIVAILAVMKAGGAYLPINPNQPIARTLDMLEDCGVSTIITNASESLENLKQSYNCLTPSVLNLDTVIVEKKTMFRVLPTSLAYIIYTSGSTGKPKGVLIQHEGVSNLIQHQQQLFKMNYDEKILLFSPYYFDASVEQIWLALSSGATLVIIEEQKLLETAFLKSYLKEHSVTHLDSTPSFLERIDLEDLPNLRRVISGGEACRSSLIERVTNKCPLYNEYGPTEATVTATYQKIVKEQTFEYRSSIGKPIANTKIYILCEDMKLLPQGAIGELYIGGKGLSLGYLNRLDLTEKRFIKNPFGEGRLYKTGDLARWKEDGRLEYLGRNDDQVKLRGYRIELGEIECQLENLEQINQSLVITFGSEENKQLVAYLCGEKELKDSEIKSFLLSKLPNYMIPTGYIWIDSFPLNANDKIDKKALPSPDFIIGKEYIAPNTEEQEKLVGIWSEVLGFEKEKISISSDFFQLGGHSLSAITLVNKINQIFNVEVSLQDLFLYRTVLELSIHISGMNKGNYISIDKAPIQNSYPLSSAQRRMYFLYEFDKEGTSYNMPDFYRVSKNIEAALLNKIFKELVMRHQSLRTIFELEDGQPVQRILEADLFEVTYDKGEVNDIDRYIKNFVRPFNLSKDLPYRVSLIDILGEDYLLMIDTHHIVNDGVSNEILIRDFWLLYKGYKLPELDIQYVDYSVWQQEEAQKSLTSSHKEFWLERYSEDLSILELPTDYSRIEKRSNKGGVYSIELNKSQSEKLSLLAVSEGVTMYTLFFAVYNVLLSKLSNQQDIVVGTPTAGRHHSDLEGVVGMFVNTLALRNQVCSEVIFKDFLFKLQEDTLMAFDHQSYQYDELVDALNISRDSSRNPLFDVFFSYNQQIKDTDFKESDDLKIISHNVNYDIAKFDLELDVVQKNEGCSIIFNYNSSLFKEKTIIRFSNYFKKIIEVILFDKNIEISKIDILSKEEKNQIINEFNKPEIEHTISGTVIDLIEKQVTSNPLSEALCFKGEVINYNTLNRKVNQLTHYFLDVIKVEKGDRIGIYFERSPEMIISLLAILKSGATYIALDPENPLDRLKKLIDNSGIKYIVTNLSTDLINVKKSVQVIDLLAQKSEINKMLESNPIISIQKNDPAYIIFTSGSTGKPKGVIITHDSLIDYSLTFTKYFSITSSDKVIQQASPAFDTMIEEIFPALLSGASVVIMPEGGRNIEALVKGIEETKATILTTVPVVLDVLNNFLDNLKSLRFIISGGDVLLPRHISNLIKNYPIYNTYGPSESTVCITYHEIDSLEKASCIGRPISNRSVYILNKAKQLCPIGVSGELYVSGKGLAKGYLNDDKLTKIKFVENPIVPGTRVYATGDMAKWNENGTIDFIGRVDKQIKIGGVRIELGEIESQLEKLEFINQSLVMDFDVGDNKQLVAYLCGNDIEGEKIKRILSSKLPNYMIPNVYVQLESFPVNSNGKIDRKSLPNPSLRKINTFISPSNEIQEKLVSVWSNILKITKDKISMNSDFFLLGGNSLLGIKLKHEINKEFGFQFSLTEIFLNPTIMYLSNKIEEKEEEINSKVDLIPLNNEELKEKLFIIHDGSGEIEGYLELTRNIKEYQCYGIMLDDNDNKITVPSIPEIASFYIKKIKTIQPFGPYNLLGWSLGGEIATEITLQLESNIEKVEKLVLIDSYLKYDKPVFKKLFNIDSELELMSSIFNFYPKNRKEINSFQTLESEFLKSSYFKGLTIGELQKIVPQNIKELIPDYFNKNKKELFKMTNKIRRLIASSEVHFVNKQISANTLYICPSESPNNMNFNKLRKVFKSISINNISGDHFSIMKTPEVMKLSNCIEKHFELTVV